MSAVASPVAVFSRSSIERSNRWTTGPAIVFYVAAFKLLLQLLVAGRYGYYSDELYFLVCGAHPALGYIDHPPFTPLIAFLVQHTLGTSLLALRFLPALAGALLICVLGAITRRLGGGRFAQALAAVAALTTPVYLCYQHYFHIVAFEPLIWAVIAYCLLRAVETNEPRHWLGFGLAVGIGLENKYTVAIYFVGLIAGLMWGHAREVLRSSNFWAACGVAFLVFMPNLIWLMQHDFPFLKWQHKVQAGQVLYSTYAHFWRDQFVLVLPSAAVLIAGLWFFLVHKLGKAYRFLGVAVLAVFACVMLAHAKSYYSFPVFGIAFTGGAVLLEDLTRGDRWRWLRWLLLAEMVVVGAVMAPSFIPILPIEHVASYQSKLPLPLPYAPEPYMLETPTPLFSWEFGAEEVVSATAELYRKIPDTEKPRVGIMSDFYGNAGAIDLLGPKYGLPKAMCSHLAYHDWGTNGYHGDVLIMVGYASQDLRSVCGEVRSGPVVVNPFGYSYQRGQIVNLCVGGLASVLSENWERLDKY